MDYIRHGPGPPLYHPQHGSGGMGQSERSTSNTTQHQRQPDVNWNPIVKHGIERQLDAGFNGFIGDGSKADRVCGLRPSCITPTQPHRRHSATPSSSQRGTSYSGHHDPGGMMHFGYDDGGATITARQSLEPTRERARSLDLAHGSPRRPADRRGGRRLCCGSSLARRRYRRRRKKRNE